MPANKQGAPKRHPRKMNQKGYLVIAVIAIIIIIAVLSYISASNAPLDLGSGGNVTISSSGIAFVLGGSEYVAYIGTGASNSTAQIYLARQPAFINPLFDISINTSAVTHVNYNSKFSNIGIKLISVKNGTAIVNIISISNSLAIAPDTQYIKIQNLSISALPSSVSPTPANYTATKTTVPITSTTTSTVSSTAPPNNYDRAEIALQKSAYYPIMLNYSVLYANTRNCTPNLYNKTYSNYLGYPPSGQYSYQNVSSIVPYNLSLSINSVSGSLYKAVYSTKSRQSISTGPAITITINATAESIINATLTGVFSGLNQSALTTGYKAALQAGGACGIYVS